MANTSQGNFLNSPQFLFYAKLVSCAIAGGGFVFFILKNQLDYYKEQKTDLEKKYELNEQANVQKCETGKTLLKINIENSMLLQYRKFGKNSKESKLFLETIDLLNEKNSK